MMDGPGIPIESCPVAYLSLLQHEAKRYLETKQHHWKAVCASAGVLNVTSKLYKGFIITLSMYCSLSWQNDYQKTE